MTYQEPVTFGEVMAIAAMKRAETDAESKRVARERKKAFRQELKEADSRNGRTVKIDWRQYTAFYIESRQSGKTLQQITDLIGIRENVYLTTDTVRQAMFRLGVVVSSKFGRSAG